MRDQCGRVVLVRCPEAVAIVSVEIFVKQVYRFCTLLRR